MQLARLAGFPVKVLVSFRNQVRVMGFPGHRLPLCTVRGARGSAALFCFQKKAGSIKAHALEVSRRGSSAKK